MKLELNFDIRPPSSGGRRILPKGLLFVPHLALMLTLGAVCAAIYLQVQTRTIRADAGLVEGRKSKVSNASNAYRESIRTLNERMESAKQKAVWVNGVFSPAPYLHALLVSERATDDRLTIPKEDAGFVASLSEADVQLVRATQLIFSDITPDGDAFTMTLRGVQLQSGTAGAKVGKAWFNLLGSYALRQKFGAHKVNPTDEATSDFWAFSTTFKKDTK